MAFSMKFGGKSKKQPLSAAPASGKKQYGLILPKKDAKKELPAAFNAFESAAAASSSRKKTDSESTADAKAEARRRVGAEAARSFQQSQVDRQRAQALADDPSVFDYDAVYDDMKSAKRSEETKREAQRQAEKKQSKYIGTLLKQAKIREVENERIRERRLLHEREADDALYGDKEKLVSASYKRKLQDMQRWDQEDARLAALEERDDVTKQGEHAMASFYANLNKNIAMGGSTAQARSAYTAKDSVDEPPAVSPASTSGGTTLEKEESVVKKARRVEDDMSKSSSVSDKEKRAETSEPRQKPQEEPKEPKISKEDAIAAAKARFLARKAQRQASKSSS